MLQMTLHQAGLQIQAKTYTWSLGGVHWGEALLTSTVGNGREWQGRLQGGWVLSVEGRTRGTERVLDQGDGGRSCREGTPAARSVTGS